jgi:NADH-quinone oxidoreductase subunit M
MPASVVTNSLGIPLLSLVLFLPGIVALLIALGFGTDAQARIASSVTVVANLILALFLLAKFEWLGNTYGSNWAFQFEHKHDWIDSLGITYWIGVDGISVFLVALTTLIFAVAVLAATYMIAMRLRLFLMFMLFLETAVLGVFVSLNLFLFFVFWEAMLIPSYFLLGIWGEERRVYATMKFFIYTVAGSFLMLVGIFYLWAQRGTLDMVGPNGLIAHPVSSSAQTWLFLAFGIAFAIKLPIWPFHTWAPTAYTESPVPFGIVLAGILSKAGVFGFLRYCLPLFPAASRQFAALISILAIIGMLYAACLALVQSDIKRIVAYASVSHMNLMALGIFAFNPTSIDGVVVQMINHSMIITGLFLTVAFITSRTGTRMLRDLGGLGRGRPWLMWLFFVFILAGLDLPGMGSFAGEFLILAGVFLENAWFSSIAAITVILAAWYMIRFFQDSMNGPVTAVPQQVGAVIQDRDQTEYQFPVRRRLLSGDLLPREAALFVPLILLILYIGVQPNTLTSRMNPTTTPLSSLVRSHIGTQALGGGR